MATISTGRGEVLQIKSAAEFFTENQNIAGFDNPGKSLYTTIRELVENSLDAAESIGVPPTIVLTIEELSQKTLDAERGMSRIADRVDETLFCEEKASNGKKKKKAVDGDEPDKEDKASGRKALMYYRVTCRDNGCGMRREQIPDALGRVLAGSKYGVRQTRGKFGLGAKMALIWAKKSSGLPILVKSAVAGSRSRASGDDGEGDGAATMSRVVLDIDIHKNEPCIIEDEALPNPTRWRGTELTVTVGGAWSAYKSRITTYLQQLAIITPYAALALTFSADGTDPASRKRDLSLNFERRTTKLPPLPKQTGIHPSAVDELLVQQLLRRSKHATLVDFLAKGELSSITPALARRVLTEAGGGFGLDEVPKAMAKDVTRVARLTRLLKEVTVFPPPDGSCLSPVGEYNLRLGITKELRPDFVATYAMSKPGVHAGHPFLVEAAVSIGGDGLQDAETLHVHRFANRIPLLFEGGADVATRVAKTKVRWANYKIDPKKERVGVFVSLVSTRVPFKGTSKEYIGEDATEIHDAVKMALQHCGQQLKAQLLRRAQAKEGKTRKKNLLRYVPDVASALWHVLGPLAAGGGDADGGSDDDDAADAAYAAERVKLRRRLGGVSEMSQATLDADLRRAVDRLDSSAVDGAGDDAATGAAVRIDARRCTQFGGDIPQPLFVLRLALDCFDAGAFHRPRMPHGAAKGRRGFEFDDEDDGRAAKKPRKKVETLKAQRPETAEALKPAARAPRAKKAAPEKAPAKPAPASKKKSLSGAASDSDDASDASDDAAEQRKPPPRKRSATPKYAEDDDDDGSDVVFVDKSVTKKAPPRKKAARDSSVDEADDDDDSEFEEAPAKKTAARRKSGDAPAVLEGRLERRRLDSASKSDFLSGEASAKKSAKRPSDAARASPAARDGASPAAFGSTEANAALTLTAAVKRRMQTAIEACIAADDSLTLKQLRLRVEGEFAGADLSSTPETKAWFKAMVLASSNADGAEPKAKAKPAAKTAAAKASVAPKSAGKAGKTPKRKSAPSDDDDDDDDDGGVSDMSDKSAVAAKKPPPRRRASAPKYNDDSDGSRGSASLPSKRPRASATSQRSSASPAPPRAAAAKPTPPSAPAPPSAKKTATPADPFAFDDEVEWAP